MSCECTSTTKNPQIDLAAAIAAATNAVDLDVSVHALAALPDNWKTHDLESIAPNRRRMRGNMQTSSIESFAAYVHANRQAGATIFVDAEKMKALAVLNLGTPLNPLHCDNTATAQAKQTAAYNDLLNLCGSGHRSQQAMAEWLEDHVPYIETAYEDSDRTQPIATKAAIAAIRKITTESARKLECEVGELSASRSAFESVQIKSKSGAVPTQFKFSCIPYLGLQQRTFYVRLTIATGQDKPTLRASIINAEQHAEEMGEEFSTLVDLKINPILPIIESSGDAQELDCTVDSNHIPVLIGTYNATR